MATAPLADEQRIVLRNVECETYERLLQERGEHRTPRYTYDRGLLEVMSPLSVRHERDTRSLESVVRIVVNALDLPIISQGSATLRLADTKGDAEPDCSFYIANEAEMRGQSDVNLAADPPPDLAIEVDVTHPTLDKLPVYARFGVPEVWRYDGQRLEVYVLEGDRYAQVPESCALPGVRADAVRGFILESRDLPSTEWERRIHESANRFLNNTWVASCFPRQESWTTTRD